MRAARVDTGVLSLTETEQLAVKTASDSSGGTETAGNSQRRVQAPSAGRREGDFRPVLHGQVPKRQEPLKGSPEEARPHAEAAGHTSMQPSGSDSSGFPFWW